MKQRNVVPLLAAFAGIVGLGLSAAALSSSLPPGASYTPPEVDSGSGLSLYALLLLFVQSILRFLFGSAPSSPAGRSGSIIELLVAAVRVFYQLLPLLLAGIVVAIAVASAFSYAGRGPLSSLSASLQDTIPSDRSTPEERTTRSVVEPSNEVYRAWLSMIRQINPDRIASKTPAECATAAIETGLSRPAVETLTTEFEAVRYGGAPVTAEREQRAHRALSQLDIEIAPEPETDPNERDYTHE